MKQLTTKQFITLLLVFWMAAGCRKETAPIQNTASDEKTALTTTQDAMAGGRIATTETVAVTPQTVNTGCGICTADSKVFNLLDILQTKLLNEGYNVVSDLGSGMQAIALVQKGQIVQWLLQDKTGKQFMPGSTEKKETLSYHLGAPASHVWIVCTTTSCGTFCMSVVWEWLDTKTHL